MLSGSPIAATSLTLLDGGLIDRNQAFAMLTGSRLGASFIVLVVGFLYAVRRTSGRRAPLSIGILSLVMTVVAYVPGAFVGWLLLREGFLEGIGAFGSSRLFSVTELLFGWPVNLAERALPDWTLFLLGIVVLLLAFRALDVVLPPAGRPPPA